MVQTHSGLQWSDPAPATTSQQPALTEETWPAHGSVEELIRLLKDCDAEGSPHYANEHMQRASAALTSLSAERDELRLNLSRKTANVRDLARRKGVASEYRDGFKAKASELEDENDGLRLELDLEIHARKMAEAEATSLRRKLEEAERERDELLLALDRSPAGPVELRAQLSYDRHRAEVAERKLEDHRKALEPFARESLEWAGYDETENLVESWHGGPSSQIRVCHLRAAARTLSGREGQDG
jgi:chromosome segregation ATPase